MLLLPFFEIPYGDRLAKNVKKQYVQVIPRSTYDLSFSNKKDQLIVTTMFSFLKDYNASPFKF